MSIHLWEQRIRAVYYEELGTGTTHEEMDTFIEHGASCPWESTAACRSRIEAEKYLHIFPSAERVRYTVSAGMLHPFCVHRQTYTDGGIWWCPAGLEWWGAATEDEAVAMASERADEEAARWFAVMCGQEIDEMHRHHAWEMARAEEAGGVGIGEDIPF